jgi:predicted nucleic acid-binding protein
MALVLDTGVLLAAIDADDPHHVSCAQLLSSTNEQLMVPAPVLVEMEYWLGKLAGPEAWRDFIQEFADGVYVLHPTTIEALVAAADLQVRYADLRIGFVDAAVFITCVELGEDTVATLDRRHFSVLRTEDGMSLRLLP